MTHETSFRALARDLTGDIVPASDSRFEQRKLNYYSEFNGRTPLAVARVADAADVARVVGFSRDTGLRLAVRGGGHSVLGHSTVDGGLVVDMSALDEIDMDLKARTAWAGGGVLAGDYTRTVGEHGLATGFGDTGSVGIAGITLGGGVGLLHRKLGLSIDSLLGAEIVTADGAIRTIDEENDPDLFWAIRGGGGNFGVVTRLRFRLHPIDEVQGGMLILPASPELLTEFVTAARESSDELSVIGAVAVAPPLPFLPEQVHGQLIVAAFMVHAGAAETADQELGRFRSLATPLVDGLDTKRYSQMFDEDGPQPVALSVRSVFSDDLTIEDADAAIAALKSATADMNLLQVRVLGGAVARVPNDATAFGHRDREIMFNVTAAYEDPARRPEHETWVDDLGQRLSAGRPGSYLNFLGVDSPEAVRAAYPATTWQRLVDVKSKYDQDNLFSSNHNIAPAGERTEGAGLR